MVQRSVRPQSRVVCRRRPGRPPTAPDPSIPSEPAPKQRSNEGVICCAAWVPVLCWSLDAGDRRGCARSTERRPKSAKARNPCPLAYRRLGQERSRCAQCEFCRACPRRTSGLPVKSSPGAGFATPCTTIYGTTNTGTLPFARTSDV